MAFAPHGLKAWSMPWATAAVALGALLALAAPSLGDALIHDRSALLAGQVWRLWTGHLVHITTGHLLWNLALVIAAGGWLERLTPTATRWFYVCAPPLIGVTLLLLEPDLSRYGGLSGLGAGLIVLLALRQRNAPTESRGIWNAVLGLVALKVGLEAWTGAPLLADGIRGVPLAHVAGITCAVAAHLLWPHGLAGSPSRPSCSTHTY
jgi:rhomboid family GlyGly-CTERM serine protease